MYVVVFTSCLENFKEEYDYISLFDAISVAKNTEINGLPCLNERDFDTRLFELLTTGETMASQPGLVVNLYYVNTEGIRSPVYPVMYAGNFLPTLPHQRSETKKV